MEIPKRRRILLETIPHDAVCSFAFREFQLTHFPFNWHYHPELELTLIVKGSGLRFVGDSIAAFESGDLCFLGANTPHTWHSQPGRGHAVHSMVIQFSPDLFGERFFEVPEWRSLQRLFDAAKRGLRITGSTRQRLASQFTELRKIPRGSWRHALQLLSMLGSLSDSSDIQPLAAAQFEGTHQRESGRKLNIVCSYVNDHLDNLPPQKEIAKLIRLSPPAFSHFFKNCVGKTYAEYVNELRISRACRALAETDDSVTNIAFSAGFNNLSNFNRRFLQLKRMTPRQYRSQASGTA